MKNYTLAQHFLNEGVDKNNEKTPENEVALKLPPISNMKLNKRWRANPFRTLNKENWINQCQREKQRLKEQRRSERTKKVHEKHTFKSRNVGPTLPAIKQMFKDMDEETTEDELAAIKRTHLSEAIAQTSKMCRVRHVEREFTHELIQRKREMFLVNYSIRTKRNKIAAYKAKEESEEKKINEIAARLHNDAVLFDDFLKATDQAAVDAMKGAEKETRTKFEKIAETRRYQAKVAAMKANLSKQDEQLLDYLSYKEFLMQVHHNLTTKDKDLMMSDEWDKKRIADIKAKKQNMFGRNSLTKQSSRLRKSTLKDKLQKEVVTTKHSVENAEEQASKFCVSKTKYPEEWDPASDSLTVFSEIGYILENPVFLTDIIHDMEEENLKLIYHFQNSEESVDEMKQSYRRTKERMDKELEVLAFQVSRMEELIEECDTKCDQLQVMCQILEEGVNENGDQAMDCINSQVAKVYKNVLGRLVVNMDGLVMLTCIENRMDELLDEIDSFPPEAVKEIQKIKDKQRRLVLREEKLAIQRQRQEERSKRAQERANAGTYRCTGRRLIFRSEPIRAKDMVRIKTDGLVMSDSSLFFDKD